MTTTGDREPHLREMGAFLRTRRGELSPGDVGVSRANRRSRVTGLRREEVADLARISGDYYARIEQGRLAPSPAVLAALVSALRLDGDQAEYLGALADHAAAPSHALGAVSPSQDGQPSDSGTVRPQVMRLLDQLTETPALVMGPRTDILAWNPLAARVYVDFGALAPDQRNYVRLIFTDQRMRRLFDDWESVARSCVAILRREAAANPSDPRLTSLVGELTVADDDFARWWAAHDVARQDFGTKVLHHPEVGDLTLDWEIFRYGTTPDQQLILNSVEPGSATQQRLATLMRPVTPVTQEDFS
jgi:transcriptional regulator with XRE-family HTH domain